MKILKVTGKISFKELDFQQSCNNERFVKEGAFISFRIAQDWSTHEGIEGGGSTPQENPKTKNILKRSIINAFPGVVLFASNLVLRHLKV